jgi:hypothetical protein
VLRIWREKEDFAGFACARCGEKGWAREGGSTSPRPFPERLVKIRSDAAKRQAAEQAGSLRKCRWLWSASVPIASASPPLVYLREARRYRGPIPATLRWLPPRKPEHHHVLIAAFGLATEPEPGVLSVADAAVVAVHLTLLQPDGTAKADVDIPKLIIGQGSAGVPICIAPPNDVLGLAITEGIEDGLSAHCATGLGVWVAGSAGRMPPLADMVPIYVDCVTVVADADPAGRRHAVKLAARLVARGIETRLAGEGGQP